VQTPRIYFKLLLKASFFQLQGMERTNIANCFKTKDFSSFMTTGIRVEGTMYIFLREEDQKIAYGKNKGVGSITAQATKTAVVVAHCPDGSQHGFLNKGVNVIAEYLESLGM